MIDGATPIDFDRIVADRLDGVPLVVLLDIDGTLAPIAPRPEDARVPRETLAILRRLVALPHATTALVTGRSAVDGFRMGVEGLWVIGNHGLELRSPDGSIEADTSAARYESAMARAVEALRGATGDGILIEDKRWSVAVHYRLARPDALPALGAHVAEVAKSNGLRVTEGKKIFEVRPPVNVDKGSAVLRFLERVGALTTGASHLFAGDDRTDEDAFMALRGRSSRAVTVRVLSNEDANRETAAELTLDSPEEVQSLLRWLTARRESADAARRS